MPGTPIEHLEYTINEWNGNFYEMIEKLYDINTVFDVGANAGGFCLVIRKRFPNCKLVTFEPIKETFDFLKNQIDALHIQKAVQYGTKETKMYWRGSNIGACFTEEVNAGSDRIPRNEVVECTTLEEVGIIPDLVKIDVEGAEENILSNSTLIKTTPYIILEWHPDHVSVLDFIKRNLPNHVVIHNIENKQLCLRYRL